MRRTVDYCSTSKRRPGFTVLELLVVTAIGALLVGLLLPAVQQAREAARRLDCANRLKQIGLALMEYEETALRLPPGWQLVPSGGSGFAWSTALLPYLDQAPLERTLDRRQDVLAAAHDLPRHTALPAFLCPSDVAPAIFEIFPETEHGVAITSLVPPADEPLGVLPVANYVAVFGTLDPDDVPGPTGDGPFPQGRGVRLAELVRGTSHTVLVGERTFARVGSTWLGVPTLGEDSWARVTGNNDLGPNRPDADEGEFDSRHPQCVQFVFGDGSVRAVGNSIERAEYRRMSQRE